MDLYSNLIKPLIFRLPPERAQRLAHIALRAIPLWKVLGQFWQVVDPRLSTTVANIKIPNPIGLAAGYDKNCEAITSLYNLGFGYIVGGTVTSHFRTGNPAPRLLRDPSNQSLINSLGFPSKGLEAVSQELSSRHHNANPLLISISGLSIEEFVDCYKTLQPVSSGIELNISSPNTEGIRIFQEPDMLRQLLAALTEEQETPIFIKLPPYFDEPQRTRVMKILDVCLEYNLSGVTAANTRPVRDVRLAIGQGGMSGKPIFPDMLRIVRDIRKHTGPQFAINACGGISSGEDALAAIQAGANTIQIYTAFVYQGPALLKRINSQILSYLDKEGVDSLESLASSIG